MPNTSAVILSIGLVLAAGVYGVGHRYDVRPVAYGGDRGGHVQA